MIARLVTRTGPPFLDPERDVGVAVGPSHRRIHRHVRKAAPLVQHLEPEHVAAELGLVEVALLPQADPPDQRKCREPARLRRADRRGERGLVDGGVAFELELTHDPRLLLRGDGPERREPDQENEQPGSGKSEAGRGAASQVDRNYALRGREDRPRNLRPAIDAML